MQQRSVSKQWVSICKPQQRLCFGLIGSTFQHDKDHKHTADAVKAYLIAKNETLPVTDWHSQSPDLEIIKADHLDRDDFILQIKQDRLYGRFILKLANLTCKWPIAVLQISACKYGLHFSALEVTAWVDTGSSRCGLYSFFLYLVWVFLWDFQSKHILVGLIVHSKLSSAVDVNMVISFVFHPSVLTRQKLDYRVQAVSCLSLVVSRDRFQLLTDPGWISSTEKGRILQESCRQQCISALALQW